MSGTFTHTDAHARTRLGIILRGTDAASLRSQMKGLRVREEATQSHTWLEW